MAIAVDARNAGTHADSVSSISWTHTATGVSTNGVILVAAQTDAATNITSVTWDSGGTNASMTRKARATSGGGSVADIYSVQNPSATGAKLILISMGITSCLGGQSISLTGVGGFNAASPQIQTNGLPTNPSLAVTSATGEWVVDCANLGLNSTGTSITKGASQTLIGSWVDSGTNLGGSSDRSAAGASTTMSWTFVTASGNDLWGQSALSLTPPDLGRCQTSGFHPKPPWQQRYTIGA